MAETVWRNPRLTFERPSYEADFHDGLRQLSADTRDLFLAVLHACLGENSRYIGKVVLGARPFAVQIFESAFPDQIVAWLAPRQTHVLVRLYRGTYVGDVLNLVTNPAMRGTPHPMNLRIKTSKEIPTALSYIETSACLRNGK
jgi:hypothetical protein